LGIKVSEVRITVPEPVLVRAPEPVKVPENVDVKTSESRTTPPPAMVTLLGNVVSARVWIVPPSAVNEGVFRVKLAPTASVPLLQMVVAAAATVPPPVIVRRPVPPGPVVFPPINRLPVFVHAEPVPFTVTVPAEPGVEAMNPPESVTCPPPVIFRVPPLTVVLPL
jgi:hypothetical protein